MKKKISVIGGAGFIGTNLCDLLNEKKIPFEEIFPAEFDHRTSDSLMDSLTVDMAERGVRDLWHRCQGVA